MAEFVQIPMLSRPETIFTDADLKALRKKEAHPEEQVVCPRCGEEIGFRSIGSSYEVKCPTKDCIKMTVRGI